MTEDKQRIAAPAAALTPELRAALIAHKTELLGLLTRMEEYRALLQKAFSRVAARKGPTEEESERFLAGSLLARTRGTDDLAALQLTSLVSLELALIQAGRAERMDAEQVLAASAEALDGSLLG